MIIIGEYSKVFDACWKHYSETLRELRSLSVSLCVGVGEVYLPSTAGSKQGAWDRWSENLKEISFSGGQLVSEELLMIAIDLFCTDRIKEAREFRRVRMPMMSVFLNPKPRYEKQPEIIDYLVTALSEKEDK